MAAHIKAKTSSCLDSEGSHLSSNPAFQAFENQLEFCLAKKKASVRKNKHVSEVTDSKVSNSLFDLWNTYENRLPKSFLYPRMLDVGDFLSSVQEHSIALRMCYDFYLIKSYGCLELESITSVSYLQQIFFPNGLCVNNVPLALRAMLGRISCSFNIVMLRDQHLEKDRSIQQATRLLAFLQIVMECILPEESLCWIVYNASVHMYSICRQLMKVGRSSLVIDYLLWTSICMESSIPLVGVKYLGWRSTLYTAVCQCYNDLKQGHMSEAFARRAIAKIDELSKLMKMSVEQPNKDSELSFTEATVKMAVMVFKRAVFETRKRPKGALKPKQTANLKEVVVQTWPRTATEKLLVGMCRGSAAQALCILESLTDSNRRILLSAAPVVSDPLSDSDVPEVYVELLMAAQEIIGGGGGSPGKTRKKDSGTLRGMSGVVNERTMMDLASNGEDGVTLGVVVKFVKWSYCYQLWDFFDVWFPKVLAAVTAANDVALATDLKIIQLFDRIATPRGKHRKQQDDDKDSRDVCDVEDTCSLAETMLSAVEEGLLKNGGVDINLIIDASVWLWNKCKTVFGQHQSGIVDSPRFLEKIENCSLWVSILEMVHRVIHLCGLGLVDPVMSADMSLRLALILESASEIKRDDESRQQQYMFSNSNLDQPVGELLKKASYVLEAGLKNIALSADFCVPNDSRAIADVAWIRFSVGIQIAAQLRSLEYNPYNNSIFDTTSVESHKDAVSIETPNADVEDATAVDGFVWEQMKDMHCELLFHSQRINLKLILPPTSFSYCETSKQKPRWKNPLAVTKANISNLEQACAQLIKDCRRNRLSLSLLCLQRALVMNRLGRENKEAARKLVEEAAGHLRHFETDERRLYKEHVIDVEAVSDVTSVPPAPILVSRNNTTMTLRPGCFTPASGEKVAWYRLFGRMITTSDIKARLVDNAISGTGEEISADMQCEFRVTGLKPGEKYTFSVAAYTVSGQLIGCGGGESTKPILASHPMSVLMARNYLCQVAYQVGHNQQVKETFAALWCHFVAVQHSNQASEWTVHCPAEVVTFSVNKFNERILKNSSQVLLRSLVSNVFAAVDVTIREEQLYCDVLCEKKAFFHEKQVRRINVCEVLLPAMELAAYVNDTNSALQAVVYCYGLLVPLLHFKIASPTAILKILEQCAVVLQEIPGPKKRAWSTAGGLLHMVACISYNLSKILRNMDEGELADHFSSVGRKLLNSEYDPRDPGEIGGTAVDEVPESLSYDDVDNAMNCRNPKYQTDKPRSLVVEMNALEVRVQKINKQQVPLLNGSEDMSILHSIIGQLPSNMAFAEVKKFLRRPRYIEFLIQVASKGIAEGNSELVVGWCTDAEQVLVKRNESLYGSVKPIIGNTSTHAIGDLVDHSREQNTSKQQGKQGKAAAQEGIASQQPASRKEKKLEDFTDGLTDPLKIAQAQREAKARNVLLQVFLELYRNRRRCRKLRVQLAEERPWRSELNTVQGLSHMGSLIARLESFNFPLSSFIYRTTFLDPSWFSLDAVEAILAGYEGLVHNRPVVEIQKSVEVVEVVEQKNKPGTKQKQPALIESQSVVFVSAVETAAACVVIGDVLAASTRAVKTEEPSRKNQKVVLQDIDTSVTKKYTTNCMRHSFAHFSRAVVLAHRGRHWTLLQNACRNLLNCVQLAMFASHAPDKDGCDVLAVADLREILCRPLCVAADCLLDMLMQTGDQLNRVFEMAGGDDNLKFVFPKWLGDINDEKGGAGTRFDVPLDDTTMIDVRCLKRVVLLAIEMLFHAQKWEKLVCVALRFSALTGYRYSEIVCPLLVHAQHQLVVRLSKNCGHKPPQPHFVAAVKANSGRPISATDYLQLQLRTQFNEAQIVLGTNSEDLRKRALQLCSVPLDVAYSLQTLREVLTSSVVARSLENSRRLLVLYLAGQSSPEFSAATIEPAAENGGNGWLSYIPRDLNSTWFKSDDDVTCTPVRPTELRLVISSYEKTIELLGCKGRKGLKAEALRELGNVHYHAKNVRLACRYWCESLNTLTNTSDFITQWRTVFSCSTDVAREMLERFGLWGCLISAIITSNIAQYTMSGDVGQRIECCILSGYFFKALFRSSLPHPQQDRMYALYEVGEGHEVSTLVPGVDLLGERFRSDARTVIGALRFVADELCRSHHSLFVLPLLTLYQYWSASVCRDVQWITDCRLIRLRALADLGLFTEATEAFQQLMVGEHLPQPLNGHFRPSEPRSISVKFNTQLPLVEETSMTVIDYLSHCRLSANLSSLYGPHLTCRLALVHAHLLTRIADTLSVLPDASHVPATTATLKKKEDKQTEKAPPANKQASPEQKPSKPNDLKVANSKANVHAEPVVHIMRDVSLDTVKSILLSSADSLLSSVSDALLEWASSHDGLTQMSASELELVVSARFQQAAVSVQKHHSLLAAKYLFDAMKLMQTSTLWQQSSFSGSNPEPMPSDAADVEKPSAGQTTNFKIIESKTSRYELNNSLARWHLDARLWTQCRLALVKCLLNEPLGFSRLKTGENLVHELGTVDEYCEQGLNESEACCDVELQADFLYCGALKHIRSGNSVEKSLTILKEVESMLNDVNQLSNTGILLLINAKLLRHDIEVVCGQCDRRLDDSTDVQDILLQSLESLGETVEKYRDCNQVHHSTVSSPISNIYLPELALLVQAKLRIGQALATAMSLNVVVDEFEAVTGWNQSHGVLSTAFQLNSVIASKSFNIDADILFSLGQVQHRLFNLGQCRVDTVAKTLHQAIEASIANDGDLSLMRKAYMELAMVYLVEDSNNSLQIPAADREQGTGKNQMSKERQAAWFTIGCAALCGKALRQRATLSVSSDEVEQAIGAEAAGLLPDFAALDCIGRTVLRNFEGVDGGTQANDVMHRLPKVLYSRSYGEQVENARQLMRAVSWKHVLGYQKALNRLCSTSTLNVLTSSTEIQQPDETACGEVTESVSLAIPNEHLMLFHPRLLPFASPLYLRINSLHSFLAQNHQRYAKQCTAVRPPEQHLILEQRDSGGDATSERILEKPIIKSYERNRLVGADGMPLKVQKMSSGLVSAFQDDSLLTKPAEGFVAIQWYQPALGRVPAAEADRQLVLMYCFVDKANKKKCGVRWVWANQLRLVHHRITSVMQMSQLEKLSKVSQSKKNQKKTKKQSDSSLQSSVETSASDTQQDLLMTSLQQCLSEARDLLTTPNDLPTGDKVPTITSSSSTTIKAASNSESSVSTGKESSVNQLNVMETKLDYLEQMFNASYGLITVDLKLLDWIKAIFQ